MKSHSLILFSRKGCCLCAGLEEKLRKIPLDQLRPALRLLVIDIDDDETSNEIRETYNLQVPVLAVSVKDPDLYLELPRTSPRLSGEGLFQWLQKVISTGFNS